MVHEKTEPLLESLKKYHQLPPVHSLTAHPQTNNTKKLLAHYRG